MFAIVVAMVLILIFFPYILSLFLSESCWFFLVLDSLGS